jgi:hypothetical protein
MATLQHKPDVRTVTIAIVRNQKEARRIQDNLKSEGIESILTAERSVATAKSTKQELGAVKVQVARSDVQRALSTLGAKNTEDRGKTEAQVAGPKTPTSRSHKLARRDPTVPAIVVVFIIIAALILFLS